MSNSITCGSHFYHADISNHVESALYKQRIVDLGEYISGKGSKGSLL